MRRIMQVGLKRSAIFIYVLSFLLMSGQSFGAVPCQSLGGYFDLVLKGKDASASLQAMRIDKADQAFITENGQSLRITTDGFDADGLLRYRKEGSDEVFTIDVGGQRFLAISLDAPAPRALSTAPEQLELPGLERLGRQGELDLRGGEAVPPQRVAPARVSTPEVDEAPTVVNSRPREPEQMRLDLGDEPVQPSLFPEEPTQLSLNLESPINPERVAPVRPEAPVINDVTPVQLPAPVIARAPVVVSDAVTPPRAIEAPVQENLLPVRVVDNEVRISAPERLEISTVVEPEFVAPSAPVRIRPEIGDIELGKNADGSFGPALQPVPIDSSLSGLPRLGLDDGPSPIVLSRLEAPTLPARLEAPELPARLEAPVAPEPRVARVADEAEVVRPLTLEIAAPEPRVVSEVERVALSADRAFSLARRTNFPQQSVGKTFTWTTPAGRVRRTGEVVRFNDESVVVKIDGSEQTIRFRDINASSIAEVKGGVRLASRSDFEVFRAGQEITFTSPRRGRRRMGEVVRVTDRGVVLDINGVQRNIPFDRIRGNSVSTSLDHFSGAFKRITDQTDFPASSIGKTISWTTPAGRVRKNGEVVRFNDKSVVVKIDGVEQTIRFRDIQSESLSIVQRNIRLAARSDFPDSLVGQDISFTTPAGRSTTTGKVVRINEGSVVVDVDGQTRRIPFRNIGGNSVGQPAEEAARVVTRTDEPIRVTRGTNEVAIVPPSANTLTLTRTSGGPVMTSDMARDAALRSAAARREVSRPARVIAARGDELVDAGDLISDAVPTLRFGNTNIPVSLGDDILDNIADLPQVFGNDITRVLRNGNFTLSMPDGGTLANAKLLGTTIENGEEIHIYAGILDGIPSTVRINPGRDGLLANLTDVAEDGTGTLRYFYPNSDMARYRGYTRVHKPAALTDEAAARIEDMGQRVPLITSRPTSVPARIEDMARQPVQLELDLPTGSMRPDSVDWIVDSAGNAVRGGDSILRAGGATFSRRLADGTLEFITRSGRLLRLLPRGLSKIKNIKVLPSVRGLARAAHGTAAVSRQGSNATRVDRETEPGTEPSTDPVTEPEPTTDPEPETTTDPEPEATTEPEPETEDPFAKDREEAEEALEEQERQRIPPAPRGNPVRPSGIPGIKNTIMIKRGVL